MNENQIRSPSDLPEYLEAVEREQLVRCAALLRLPEKINGFTVMPMTLNHYSILRIAGSPFLPPFRAPNYAELAAFLWVLNPGYCLDKKKRDKFLKTCRMFRPPKYGFRREARLVNSMLRLAETAQAAQSYVAETFQDRPPAVSDGIQPVEYYADEISVVATLSREYGWSPEDIANMPLKVVFQYLKEICEHHAAMNGKPAMLCNPSGAITAKYMAEKNRKLKRN